MNSGRSVSVSGSPRIFEWMTKEERHFRRALPSFIASDAGVRLLGLTEQSIDVDFEVGAGEECATAFVTVNGAEQLLLKSCRTKGMLLAESYCLERWSIVVRTPRVVKLVTRENPCGAEFLLMERIEGRTIGDVNSPLTIDIAETMGRMLARMHSIRGHGFGRLRFGRDGLPAGTFATLEEELTHEFSRRLPSLVGSRSSAAAASEHVKLSIEVLADDLKSSNPSITHCDLKGGNVILAHDGQLTVIDPNCRVTHPAMCLSASLLHLRCSEHGRAMAEALLDGYRSVQPIPDRVLRASLLLRGLLTLSTWIRKAKLKQAAALVDYWRRLGINPGVRILGAKLRCR